MMLYTIYNAYIYVYMYIPELSILLNLSTFRDQPRMIMNRGRRKEEIPSIWLRPSLLPSNGDGKGRSHKKGAHSPFVSMLKWFSLLVKLLSFFINFP